MGRVCRFSGNMGINVATGVPIFRVEGKTFCDGGVMFFRVEGKNSWEGCAHF